MNYHSRKNGGEGGEGEERVRASGMSSWEGDVEPICTITNPMRDDLKEGDDQLTFSLVL